MKNREVHIKEMKLRVPGYTQERGRELGPEVARQLAKRLPAHLRNRRIDAMNLQVKAPAGMSSPALTTLITDAILKGLI